MWLAHLSFLERFISVMVSVFIIKWHYMWCSNVKDCILIFETFLEFGASVNKLAKPRRLNFLGWAIFFRLLSLILWFEIAIPPRITFSSHGNRQVNQFLLDLFILFLATQSNNFSILLIVHLFLTSLLLNFLYIVCLIDLRKNLVFIIHSGSFNFKLLFRLFCIFHSFLKHRNWWFLIMSLLQ